MASLEIKRVEEIEIDEDHSGMKQGRKKSNDIEQQGTARKHQRRGTSDTEMLRNQIYPNANTD